MPVLAGLEQSGPGDVLVVVGNDDHAVAGELFATEALRRGVAGIVIDGMCRDSRTLAGLDLPVYAKGVVPSACPARAVPVVQVPITIGEVSVRPGELVLGDDDGIVVASEQELAAVLDAAEAIQRREEALRAAIEGGRSLFDSLNYSRASRRRPRRRGQLPSRSPRERAASMSRPLRPTDEPGPAIGHPRAAPARIRPGDHLLRWWLSRTRRCSR